MNDILLSRDPQATGSLLAALGPREMVDDLFEKNVREGHHHL